MSAVSAVGASFGMLSCYAVPPPSCSRTGVCSLVGPPEMLRGHLGVALGGGDGGVPQELLDDPHVGAPGEHVGGAGMSQHVGAHLLLETHPGGVLLDHSEHPHPGEPAPAG